LPEYRRKGIATAMINKLLERLAEGEVEYAETNLNLEDNVSIQNQWKIFDSVLHKRRRSYIKTL
jgi:ribosomal protein S18 acetylase RimI-like enzyme